MWRTECFQNLTEDFQHEATMVSTLFGWPIRKIRSVILTTRQSKLCGFWKGSLVWVCARLYFVFVVFYTWIEMQSTTWLSEDQHSIFMCFFLIFWSPFVCVCALLWLWSRCRARGGYQKIGTLSLCVFFSHFCLLLRVFVFCCGCDRDAEHEVAIRRSALSPPAGKDQSCLQRSAAHAPNLFLFRGLYFCACCLCALHTVYAYLPKGNFWK